MSDDDGPDLSCFNFGDDSEDDAKEGREEMLKRHRQEEQQLRTEAKARKHAIHKADKAARAEADAALETALEDMRQRHARELGDDADPPEAKSAQGKGKASKPAQPQGGKSKADKRRAKKEEEDRERERRIADHHSGSGPSERDVELASINTQLTPLGLKVLDIAADGHCLYRAFAQQLGSGSEAYSACRQTAAQYIRSHGDDFLPYIAAEGHELGPYCDIVEKSNEWGGATPELARVRTPGVSHILGCLFSEHHTHLPRAGLASSRGADQKSLVPRCRSDGDHRPRQRAQALRGRVQRRRARARHLPRARGPGRQAVPSIPQALLRAGGALQCCRASVRVDEGPAGSRCACGALPADLDRASTICLDHLGATPSPSSRSQAKST